MIIYNLDIQTIDFTITPGTSALTPGLCVSDKLEFDCNAVHLPAEIEIIQAEVLENKGGGTLQLLPTILYLTSKDFTAVAIGSAFDSDVLLAELDEIKMYEDLDGTWQNLDTVNGQQVTQLNKKIKLTDSRMLFGQLIADGTKQYDVTSKLILKVKIQEL